MRPDDVTCVEYVHSLGILFVGGTSGMLNVWPVGFLDKEVCILFLLFLGFRLLSFISLKSIISAVSIA